MTPQLSLYLDLVRFIAAVVVVLSHLPQFGLSALPVLPSNGRDAVVVFFVLSGFVIAFATERRPRPLDYAVSRLARLYSVVLPVLLLTVGLDLIAIGFFDPASYPRYQYARLWLYLPFHGLFLGQIWDLREQAFSNAPYWSLSYEAYYYVIFAAMVFLRSWTRALVVGLLLLAVGPKLWLLWPVWLAGAWLHRNIDRLALPAAAARALCIGSVLLYAAYSLLGLDEILRRWPSVLLFGTYEQSPLGTARQFLSDYVVGVLFAANLVGFRHAGWSLPASRGIGRCAGYTFTLYLLHFPLLSFVRALGIADPGSLWHTAVALLGAGIVTVLVGQVTERRRAAWERLVRGLAAACRRAAGLASREGRNPVAAAERRPRGSAKATIGPSAAGR